jgi:DNA replicative helicase MCM subunit Mcm2 (Cdc46/Mcm family)
LADAVAFRTHLQAEISGKGSGTFSLGPSANEHEISKSETENKAKTFKLPENRDSAKIFSKKDRKSIFLELLEDAGGKMGIEELQQKAMEKGISPEKFDVTLKTLLETGEIYSPESGMIKLL